MPYDVRIILLLIPKKRELLNIFFTSVFTEEDRTTIPSFQFNGNPSHLNDIDITPAIVLD